MEDNDLKPSSGLILPESAPSHRSRWLRTLNVTDAPSHTEDPHCGSIGHVLSFPESCRMAKKYGFDAVNADRSFVREQGAPNAADLMQQHNIQPGAFAFSAAFNACYTDGEFEQSLTHFEKDLEACREAGVQAETNLARMSNVCLLPSASTARLQRRESDNSTPDPCMTEASEDAHRRRAMSIRCR